jgi:excisionase family DNA binding protein
MPPTTDARPALSVHQTADRLGLHDNTVYRLIRTGKLPAFRVGQQLRVDPGALDAFIANGGNDASMTTAKPRTEADVVDAWVERTLATAPPLTDEQRTKLAELLRPVRKAGGARA